MDKKGEGGGGWFRRIYESDFVLSQELVLVTLVGCKRDCKNSREVKKFCIKFEMLWFSRYHSRPLQVCVRKIVNV